MDSNLSQSARYLHPHIYTYFCWRVIYTTCLFVGGIFIVIDSEFENKEMDWANLEKIAHHEARLSSARKMSTMPMSLRYEFKMQLEEYIRSFLGIIM